MPARANSARTLRFSAASPLQIFVEVLPAGVARLLEAGEALAALAGQQHRGVQRVPGDGVK
jgi:hypothetical protein